MKKSLIATAVAGALFVPATLALADDAPAAPASPWSFNVGVVSDYVFRGISQTHGGAALQGGIDYTDPSGFYVGTWLSTITWVKDWLGKGDVEMDVYGGYRGNFTPDVGYDVGIITYNYPGKGEAIPTFLANPNTTEVYGSVSYKWFSAKYSRTVSSHFVGWYGGPAYDKDTKGSGYLEANGTWDLGDGWGLSAHLGHQKIQDSVSTAAIKDASYTDWNIGVTKDVGLGVVGLMYTDTDAKGSCNNPPAATNASAYCWGKVTNTRIPTYNSFKDVAKGTAVLTFKKTF